MRVEQLTCKMRAILQRIQRASMRRDQRTGGGARESVCCLLVLNLVCVFYYCRTYYKAVRVGGGGEWRTCAMRDDEPRPVWMSLPITH